MSLVIAVMRRPITVPRSLRIRSYEIKIAAEQLLLRGEFVDA
jgi:hypothetical protein